MVREYLFTAKFRRKRSKGKDLSGRAVFHKPDAIELRRRPLSRFESASIMSAIAERTFLRRTATTQSNGFLAAQIKRVAFRVFDGDRTGNEQRTIVANIDFDIRHIQIPFRIEKQAVGP